MLSEGGARATKEGFTLVLVQGVSERERERRERAKPFV